MQNIKKRKPLDVSPDEVKALIIGVFVSMVCIGISNRLGGIENPFGASALVLPALIITFVVIPTVWEMVEKIKLVRTVVKILTYHKIKSQCFIQSFCNKRLLKSQQKLRRIIFLGWLQS